MDNVMRIKEGVDLSKYGFEVRHSDEDLIIDGVLSYEIGHSRRGQFYYFVVDDERRLKIYGSEPDGSPGSLALDGVLLRMFKDGVFEGQE